jgi:hypothetical protein
MALPGTSFEECVLKAIDTLLETDPELKQLEAKVNGKVVTLIGIAGSNETRMRVAREFNMLIETEHTVNNIRVDTRVGPAEVGASRRKPLASSIAREYHGKAALYPKIFNADRDILDDPTLVEAGNKLRVKS